MKCTASRLFTLNPARFIYNNIYCRLVVVAQMRACSKQLQSMSYKYCKSKTTLLVGIYEIQNCILLKL